MNLKTTLLYLPALALSFYGCQKTTRPNIVIIYADDMGYGDMGCQNPKSKISTPNIDRLASQGMRFTDAHSASTVSSPSRYSLLTGRYHWRGHLKEGIVSQWGDPAIEKDRITIASLLKNEGYTTACIGKWHLGQIWPFKPGLGQSDSSKHEWSAVSMNGNNPRGSDALPWRPEDFDWSLPVKEGPVSKGFDYYFGTGTINFPPYTWIENDRVVEIPSEMLDLKADRPEEGEWECRPGPAAKNWDIRKVPGRIRERAVEWIDERKDDTKPFFLYYALPSPHAPIIPQENFRGKSAAGGFGDYMAETDWIVGEVMEALNRNGFENNTLVIFTSDNGPEAYGYERIRNFDHFSMGDLRGLKRDIWEGGHRIPFIARFPGKIPAGAVCGRYICQTDIMATIAGFIDASIPENAGEDSFDQSALFMGHSDISARDHVIHHAMNGVFAVRKDNWVFIEAATGEVSPEPLWIKQRINAQPDTTKYLLYNLSDDPRQTRNMSATNSDKVIELQVLLDRIREEGRSAPLVRGH